MKHLFIFILTGFICASYTAPVDNKDTNKDSKSAFGQAFDEIVVESHLTVRRKSNGRQGRTQNVTNEAPTITRTRREIKLPMNNLKLLNQSPSLLGPQKGLGASALNPPKGFGASASNLPKGFGASASNLPKGFGASASNPQKGFGASASNAQSQAFNSFGPLGSFGASSTSTQSQNFGIGPNGLLGSAGFSGTQQYNFNGQTIDIAFGNAFSNNGKSGGAAITVTGPDGKKRPLNG